jgi:hypothetical protein
MQRRKSWLLWIAVGIWLVAIVCGVVYALVYESTPTASEPPAERWPAGTSCSLAAQGATLVMFLHPHCPCSRASVAELAALMTHCQGRLHAEVLFLQPPSFSAEWAHSDLWESVSRIPGVTARIDTDSVGLRRFGARVSGETFLYRAGGELLFHGGITAGRGHVGDNAGQTAIEAAVLGGESPIRSAPVYGCNLLSLEGGRSALCPATLGERP